LPNNSLVFNLLRNVQTYTAVTAAVVLVVAGAHQAGSSESGVLDTLPTLGFLATVAGAIAFSSLAYDRELMAMYAASKSLARVCRGAYLRSAAIPIIALVIGALRVYEADLRRRAGYRRQRDVE
jgi:hypothetical protein